MPLFKHRIRISVIALVFGLFLFGGGMWWAIKDQKARLANILENRRLNNEASAELVALDTLRRQWQGVSKTQSAFSKLIPERASLVALPGRIAALGESVGVSANAAFGLEEAKTTAGKPSAIELSIFLDGQPQALEAFLAELERIYPVTALTGFDLAETSEAGKLQGVVKVSVFFRP